MPPADADNYDKVKAVFLKTFTLVPEWYRQEFRNMRPGTDQSQVEFFKLLSLTFDRWLRASEVTSYDDLYDLVVLKHFKMTLPAAEQTNLSDFGIKKGSRAAGNYTLSHRGMGYWRREKRTMTLQRQCLRTGRQRWNDPTC